METHQTNESRPQSPTPGPEQRPADGETPRPAPGAQAGGPPPGGYRTPPQPQRLLHPRKVRGGIKFNATDGSGVTGWAAQRWMRILESAGRGEALKEGLEYARAGQARRLAVLSGRIEASVQGRDIRAYTTILRLEPYAPAQWERVVASMAEGAIYAAKLLAGEIPPNIEDLFIPLGLKLFPADPKDVTVSCNCPDAAEHGPNHPGGYWCKHVCCAAYLFAERLAGDAFVMFQLRGISGHDLLENLRQQRAMATAGPGLTPVYAQQVPGIGDKPAPTLEEQLDRFWTPGPGLKDLSLPLEPPPVSHPLLRRLGGSPFQNAQFPLVGLLASCYETISEETIRTAGQIEPPEDKPAPEDDEDEAS